MTHQPGFAQAEFPTKKKTTRREKFLARMETLLPWPQRHAEANHVVNGVEGERPELLPIVVDADLHARLLVGLLWDWRRT